MSNLEQLMNDIEKVKEKESVDTEDNSSVEASATPEPSPEDPQEVSESITIEAKDEPVVESEEATEAPEMTDIEQEAMKFGWKPQGQFSDDPDDFVSAQEYMDRAPLYKQIHKLKRKERELEAGLKELAKNYSRAEQIGREKAIEEIKSQKAEAYRSGNMEHAEQLEQEHVRMLQESQGQQTPNQPVNIMAIKSHNDWQQFEGRNPWVTQDDPESVSLRLKAQAHASEYLDTVGESNFTEDHIKHLVSYVEGKIKLKPAANPNLGRPSAVAKVSNKKSSSVKSHAIHPKWEQLNSAQKMIAEKFCLGKNPDMDLNQYVKSLNLGD